MKLRNYFFGALACLALASCSSDDDAVDSGQKDGVACIAVKFEMPGTTTRAWAGSVSTDDYFAGNTDAEKKVTSAAFFLYKGNEYVKMEKVTDPALSPGTTLTVEQFFQGNHIVIVDDVAPTHILAVLNGSDDLISNINGKSLSEVYALYENNNLEGISNGLVMTNSVYVDGSSVMKATPINGKIGYGATQDEAKNAANGNPVTIHVERVFARVNVSESATITNNGETIGTTIVKPEIKGWWLDNTNKTSYVVKDLSNTYSFNLNTGESELSETNWWNDASDFRSYWANAYNKDGSVANGFAHYTWGSASKVDKYCFENVYQGNPTQIVVAAVLKDGANAVDVIQWGGQTFIGTNAKDDLFKAIITASLSDFTKTPTGGAATALEASDLKLIWNNKTTIQKYMKTGASEYTKLKDWQSLVTINETTGFTYQNGSGTTISEQEIIDAIYQKIGTVNFYNGGQTYYFTEIEHEPVYQETDFAVIRNHYYRLTLNSITGLGTPVPNPDDTPEGTDPTDPYYPDPDDPNGPENPDPTDPDPDQPIIPEKPEGNHSAISATVKILKYRVVNQGVDLK